MAEGVSHTAGPHSRGALPPVMRGDCAGTANLWSFFYDTGTSREVVQGPASGAKKGREQRRDRGQ
jgi:hypothetical protein